MKRIYHPWFAAGAALCLASPNFAVAAEAPKPVEVKTTHPLRGDIIRYVALPGTIRANQQATLYAKVGGYLKSLAVDKGDRVQTGQLLGEIEVPELLADVAKFKAELVRAEVDLKVADIEAGRLSKALKQAPDLVLPQALDNSEGRLAVAKANVDMARANLERTDTLLRYAKVIAPFGGIVTARFVDPGAFIPSATSGSAAQTAAILTIADFHTVRVQVPLPETEAALAQVGQPMKMTVEGLPGKNFAGTISRMSYALDDATRTMLIEADIPNADFTLRPGMYASARVGVEKHTNTWVIPADSLVVEKTKTSVFTLVEGKAKKVPVKVGFDDGKSVEVNDGVTEESVVIIVGKLTLADGQPVTRVEAK